MNQPIAHDSVPFTPEERRRGLFYLSLAVAGVGFAMAVQMGLNANFLKEVIGVDGFQIGMLEAIRESCGIWALLVLALLAGVCEPVVACVMLAIFAVGIGGYAFAPGYWSVVAMSVVWSQGLHVWMPLPNSMAMALAEPGRTGHRLGQVGAAGSIGFGAGLVVSYLLDHLGVSMRPMFLVAFVIGIVAALACLRIPRRMSTERPRLVFRQRYWRYYLLCFLEGWRKQIFVCFAAFLLVERFRVELGVMLLLRIIVRAVGAFTSARVGKLIDRVGERPVLYVYYGFLTAFFLGYATITSKWALCTLFVVDNAFFVFGMALNTYVNKLVPAAERTATLSMGVAMNHLAAVSMPLIGGFLWVTFGPQWAFVTGALAGVLSLVAVSFLPKLQELPQRGDPI
jgi:predicted MFS family arabinose efflux permease